MPASSWRRCARAAAGLRSRAPRRYLSGWRRWPQRSAPGTVTKRRRRPRPCSACRPMTTRGPGAAPGCSTLGAGRSGASAAGSKHGETPMQLTPKVREILSWYEGESPGVKGNLARFLMHGRLAGTGKLVILPVDQGYEHGPARSFASNPPAYDPHYLYQLAIDAGLN